MSKQKAIRIRFEGKEYVLMFTKKTFEDAINAGVSFDKVRDNPMMLEKIFYWALQAKHSYEKITPQQARRMYEAQNPKSKLLPALLELWNDVPNGLMEDDPEGETTWEANFELAMDETPRMNED